jgi:hypothetical protein
LQNQLFTGQNPHHSSRKLGFWILRKTGLIRFQLPRFIIEHIGFYMLQHVDVLSLPFSCVHLIRQSGEPKALRSGALHGASKDD